MTIKVRNNQRHLEASCAYIPFYTSFVANLVKVIRGNARLELCSDNVQYLSS